MEMEPVSAKRLGSVEEVINADMPGVFFIGDSGFIFCECPCGCSGKMRLPLYREKAKPVELSERPAWNWDGNETQPTLHPSIRDLGNCRFHGWLRNGVWTFEGDSGVGRQ